MAKRLHLRLKVISDYGLGNSVSDGGHSERPSTNCFLRYLHCTDRRRVAVALGGLLAAALVTITAELVADDLFDDALERETSRR